MLSYCMHTFTLHTNTLSEIFMGKKPEPLNVTNTTVKPCRKSPEDALKLVIESNFFV